MPIDDERPVTLRTAAAAKVLPDALAEGAARHPTALGRRLDTYLAAVVDELRARGVITGSPQRTDPAERLIGSIVLDCTAIRIAAWTPTDVQPAHRQSRADAIFPERPTPVVAIWDEHEGWCVGLHHDPSRSSRRYLHPALLPEAAEVADFVVGLAMGTTLGAARPVDTGTVARPGLRLVP